MQIVKILLVYIWHVKFDRHPLFCILQNFPPTSVEFCKNKFVLYEWTTKIYIVTYNDNLPTTAFQLIC